MQAAAFPSLAPPPPQIGGIFDLGRTGNGEVRGARPGAQGKAFQFRGNFLEPLALCREPFSRLSRHSSAPCILYETVSKQRRYYVPGPELGTGREARSCEIRIAITITTTTTMRMDRERTFVVSESAQRMSGYRVRNRHRDPRTNVLGSFRARSPRPPRRSEAGLTSCWWPGIALKPLPEFLMGEFDGGFRYGRGPCDLTRKGVYFRTDFAINRYGSTPLRRSFGGAGFCVG